MLTPAQISAAFCAVLDMPPRAADIQVVQLLGGTIDVLTDYIFDHWMGSPDDDPETRPEIRRVIADAIEEKAQES